MEYIIESFKYGLVPAIIIALYLIIVKYLDNRKEEKKLEKEKEESKKTIKINAEIIDCFNELNSYLKHITKDIVVCEDDKCTYAIKSSFKSMAYMVTKFATFTIISNNVAKNRKNIIDNIESIVSAEFADIYNQLVLYHTDSNPITSHIDNEWKEWIKSDLISIIFDETENKETRIYNIHNKINLRINNFCTNILNKYATNK